MRSSLDDRFRETDQFVGRISASVIRHSERRMTPFGLIRPTGLIAGALVTALACVTLPGTASAQNLQSFEVIERGRYLAVLGDCAACHTAPGGQPFAGGLALLTPFGKLVAPNITPDRETGIGDWTDEQIKKQENINPATVAFYRAQGLDHRELRGWEEVKPTDTAFMLCHPELVEGQS